ncbi:helix-turn-helix domain-containing protein [Ilyomonas limi]|uniref:helix-turn-helix domain-containing protein n=1 Tax=Ilyomonas limi TaxID=2575867 RepID=UPI0014856891
MPKAVSNRYYRDDGFLSAVGLRIREIRLSKDITQASLAFDCGIPDSQINRIELGKVNCSLSYLPLIAQALNVNPKDLLP